MKLGELLHGNRNLPDAMQDLAMTFGDYDKATNISHMPQVVAYSAGYYDYSFDTELNQRLSDFVEYLYNSSHDMAMIMTHAPVCRFYHRSDEPFMEYISRGDEIEVYNELINLIENDVDKQ